jgi:hypothetical protein
MARIRCIKPEFWDDQKMATISRDARLVYVGTWSHSDDHGVCRANPTFLKNKIFPHEEIPIEQFSGWLKELKMLKRIKPFSMNGESYFYLPHFKNHQRISHPSQTRYPSPPSSFLKEILVEDSGGTPESSGGIPEGSGEIPEGSGMLRKPSVLKGRGGERGYKGKGKGRGKGPGDQIPRTSLPPLPPIPKNLEFKTQDDLKARLAEIRQLKRKLEDKEFQKSSSASYNDLLCKLEYKEKKYRDYVEDYS